MSMTGQPRQSMALPIHTPHEDQDHPHDHEHSHDRDHAASDSPSPHAEGLNLEVMSQELAGTTGKAYWRSLEELAETPEFEEFVHREFPNQASEWTDGPDGPSRRQFLKLMGASLALAGLTGCISRPRQKIVPYVRAPEEIVAGKPLFYATAMTLGGVASGLLVESQMGRPIKVEGNPEHPGSLGTSEPMAQASVLGLYDPDRSRNLRNLTQPSSWSQLFEELRRMRQRFEASNGEGIYVLTETVTSPTLASLITTLFGKDKDGKDNKVKWHQYEPLAQDSQHEGTKLVFGKPLNPVYNLKNADVVVSLDADFLGAPAGRLNYVREFTDRRRSVRPKDAPEKMNRLYVIESCPTSTGMFAEHRLAIPAHQIQEFAALLASKLAEALAAIPGSDKALLETLQKASKNAVTEEIKKHEKWAGALARDLVAKGRTGKTLILPGDHQPAATHALAHLINQALGNVGDKGTVRFTRPLAERADNSLASLKSLVEDLKADKVKVLLILGGNPVFTAPPDLEFAKHLEKAPIRLLLSLDENETSRLCHWHVPEAHFLETWGDARAFDGTVSIQQPLIAPLYDQCRSAIEVLIPLAAERPDRTGHDLVKEYWRRNKPAGGDSFDKFWNRTLHDGKVPGTAFKSETVVASAGWDDRLSKELDRSLVKRDKNIPKMEVVFRPDPMIYDGRFANNGWLQETPRPLNKITWDNAALLGPRTAKKLGVTLSIGINGGEHGQARVDVIKLKVDGREVEAPIFIMPGHAEDSITVWLGHGRTYAGRVGTGTGFNAYQLRPSDQMLFTTRVEKPEKTGRKAELASTQVHHNIETEFSQDSEILGVKIERHLVRAGTAEEYAEHSDFAKHAGHDPAHDKIKNWKHGKQELTLLEGHDYSKGYKWGMVIDLNTCVGCQACVIACQAENNIPVVGKDQVLRGREMHWLRVDAYYQGNPLSEHSAVRAYHQPVPCMHCENAHCEIVCPVAATVHSDEGLNDMVYNRCVGTRYCSHNCPYKVRRFNFLQYSDYKTETLKLLHNPEVTVRTRGVMEKCTYCTQRIAAGRIEAEKRLAGALSRAAADGKDVTDSKIRQEIEWKNRVQDGEVVTACQAVCPAGAITFGDLNDPNSAVAKLAKDDRNFSLLEDLNTRPRTTYLAAVKNVNDDPDLHTAPVGRPHAHHDHKEH